MSNTRASLAGQFGTDPGNYADWSAAATWSLGSETAVGTFDPANTAYTGWQLSGHVEDDWNPGRSGWDPAAWAGDVWLTYYEFEMPGTSVSLPPGGVNPLVADAAGPNEWRDVPLAPVSPGHSGAGLAGNGPP